MVRGLRVADVIGLTFAFSVASLFTVAPQDDRYTFPVELALFAVTLPIWIALAGVYGLYSRDEVGADHSTSDELFGVVNLVTVGTWIVFITGWATGLAGPELSRIVSFWLTAILGMVGARAIMRMLFRRNVAYRQRALIVGAGDVGQLVARKIMQHPEYAIELVGFVDDDPRALGRISSCGCSEESTASSSSSSGTMSTASSWHSRASPTLARSRSFDCSRSTT